MNYFACDRFGNSIQRPDRQAMSELLESLGAPDPEHPEVSLQDASGWCVAAHSGGLVVLENVETGEGPWHLEARRADEVLEMWQELASGAIAQLRSRPWTSGYRPNT
jgi:hypothetical protein